MKLLPLLVVGLLAATAATAATYPPDDVAAMLGDLVRDFRDDPAGDGGFDLVGLRVVGAGEWHALRGEDGWQLHEGPAPRPALIYVTDPETLRRIHDGDLAALTAGGRAKMTDPAPLDFELPEGFTLSSDQARQLIPFTFHLFTRGQPEVVRFGKDHSRVVHGANASVLYYTPGLRTAWYGIDPGQHINADPSDQVNPFPTLCVFIRGAAKARIDGRETTLEAGESVLIPAGRPHEFWNDSDTQAELIIVMFGEGA